jgi:mannose-1-phosphate guanylyltransferase/mannose-6-phosphate isomerase
MTPIIPVILSGGSGTRLWPLSRATKPKQFLNFGSRYSLFQDTVLRCRSDLFDPRPILVGADAHRFLIAEDLLQIGITADILLEPVARNSCAAIAAGCLHALTRTTDALVLVLAADHHIPDTAAFEQAVLAARQIAHAGRLVTFGVLPEKAATAYGYICPGEAVGACFEVASFVEKPTEILAQEYVAKGFLWNSGNFLFRADCFLSELQRFQPDILTSVETAYGAAQRDLDFLRLDRAGFESCLSISVDYAVMEKTDRAVVLPVSYAWSDVGSWDAVAAVIERDHAGNAVVGDAALIDSSRNLVHSESQLTTMIGVDDLVVVSTKDSLLVAKKERAQDVKELVARLQKDGRSEANEALKIFRPWGNYDRLDIGIGYQVKRIVVKPGGILSLQKHRHRAEHWVIVQGEAEVTIENTICTVSANQSAYVPLGAIHRLANRGTKSLVLIEVQTGTYLGEDDIVRFEDDYNRVVSI